MEHTINTEIGSSGSESIENNRDDVSTSNSPVSTDSADSGRSRRGRRAKLNPGFNPSTSSDSGDSDSGRSESGRSEANRKYKSKKESVNSLAAGALFLSMIASAATKSPELQLEKEEAEKLATSYLAMSEAWGWENVIDPRYVASFTFAYTAGAIFIPKTISAAARKKAEREAEQERLMQEDLNNGSTN